MGRRKASRGMWSGMVRRLVILPASRATVFMALALMMIMVFAAAAGVAEENLLLNGDFEGEWEKISVNTSVPAGWTTNPNYHDVLGPELENKVQGEAALQIITSARRNAQVLNSVGIPVEAKSVYTLSYWIYVQEGGIGMGVVDNIGRAFIRESIRRHYADDFAPDEWQYYELEFTVPEGSTEIRICLSQSPLRDVARTEVYLDVIQLKPAE